MSATTRSRRPSTRVRRPYARSRTAPGSTSTPAAPARWSPRARGQAVLEAFQRAVEASDLQALMDVLAPDVVAGQRRRRRQTEPRCSRSSAGEGDPHVRRQHAEDRRHAHRRTDRDQRQPGAAVQLRRGDSTASSRCGSRTATSPASTTSATRRSCPGSSPKPRSPCAESVCVVAEAAGRSCGRGSRR